MDDAFSDEEFHDCMDDVNETNATQDERKQHPLTDEEDSSRSVDVKANCEPTDADISSKSESIDVNHDIKLNSPDSLKQDDSCKASQPVPQTSEAGDPLSDKFAHTNSESSEESDNESVLSEEVVRDRTLEATKLKEEGNAEYKNGNFQDAMRLYTDGIKLCPKCSRKERAVLHSNRSACYVKLDRIDDAIKDCSEAIDLHPQYVKAYLRRAQLYDDTEKYEEAQKDYEKVLELDNSVISAHQALAMLPEKIEKRNEKLKQQMMSSLKDLGNLFLKPFGLSTNNFQMQQDPNSGSYNIQFNNNPGPQASNGPAGGE